MPNQQYPNNNCGECPGWLALGEDNGPRDVSDLIETMCYKCPLYTSQKYGDSVCLGCGQYADDGQLCPSCLSKIHGRP